MPDVTSRNTAQIRAVDAEHCIASWRNVLLVVWRNETALLAVKSLHGHLASFTEDPPGGCALLTIIEPGAPMPSPEARTALAQFMTAAKDRLKSSAVAFEGAGFRAAAVRGVVTGLTMLARQPYPHKVFATVEDAATWLGSSMRLTAQTHLDASALIEAVRELRERVVAHK